MAERQEPAGDEATPESEAAPHDAAPNSAALAAAMALGRAGSNPALDKKAAAFLDEQTRMLRLQMEHLHEQRALQVQHLEDQSRHLRLRHFNERLNVGLKLLTIAIGAAVAIGLGAMVWSAANDHGLVVQPFQVPPELAQQGLGGQALAAQVLDRMVEMDAQSASARSPGTYSNDWGEDVKLEIPETGVSVGELQRWLQSSLGHQTRISGELYKSPQGLVLTVRAGAHAGQRFVEQGEDFDGLVARAADALYEQTQPYRYSKYLEEHGRLADSMAASLQLTHGPREDQPWAWAQVANLDLIGGDYRAGVDAASRAMALRPDLNIGFMNRAGGEEPLGWDEQALSDLHGAMKVVERDSGQITRDDRYAWQPVQLGLIADYLGDRQTSARQFAVAAAGPDFQHVGSTAPAFRAYELALGHDIRGASAASVSPALSQISTYAGEIAFFPYVAWAEHAALDDWTAVLVDLDQAEAAAGGQSKAGQTYIERWLWPLRAQALAALGRGDEAQRAADLAPLDCYLCLRMRGVAAASRRDWPAAAGWFAQAARQSPSIPFAYADWGRMLLAKGDVNGAVAKFALARAKGPHFADALELCGEALLRKGDVLGAVAKFREADQNAPRWGRNHLRWGQALARLGHRDEARAQYRAAAQMDLSAADRIELTKALAHG